MRFASGVQAALRKEDGFRDPSQAAGFWAAGGAEIPTRELRYTGAAAQEQRMRLYRGGESDAVTFLYIHGGGWVGGSIDLHDRSARGLAAAGACNVLSISYRLAPEHPFPAGLEDCLAAAMWVDDHGARFGISRNCVAMGGASAGANLAIAAALSRPNRFAGLLLFYGIFGCDFETDSYRKYDKGPVLTRSQMKEFFAQYDPNQVAGREPLITPLLSRDLSGLPPTCIIAAEHDVLLDENVDMSRTLLRAGVPVEFSIEPGVPHGFINRGRLVPSADLCIEKAGSFLAGLGGGDRS